MLQDNACQYNGREVFDVLSLFSHQLIMKVAYWRRCNVVVRGILIQLSLSMRAKAHWIQGLVLGIQEINTSLTNVRLNNVPTQELMHNHRYRQQVDRDSRLHRCVLDFLVPCRGPILVLHGAIEHLLEELSELRGHLDISWNILFPPTIVGVENVLVLLRRALGHVLKVPLDLTNASERRSGLFHLYAGGVSNVSDIRSFMTTVVTDLTIEYLSILRLEEKCTGTTLILEEGSVRCFVRLLSTQRIRCPLSNIPNGGTDLARRVFTLGMPVTLP